MDVFNDYNNMLLFMRGILRKKLYLFKIHNASIWKHFNFFFVAIRKQIIKITKFLFAILENKY